MPHSYRMSMGNCDSDAMPRVQDDWRLTPQACERLQDNRSHGGRVLAICDAFEDGIKNTIPLAGVSNERGLEFSLQAAPAQYRLKPELRTLGDTTLPALQPPPKAR